MSRGARVAWIVLPLAAALVAGLVAWPRLRPVRGPAAAPTPEPAVALRLKDGPGTVTLRADGTILGLEAYPAELQAAVARALSSGRLDTPDLSELVAPVVEEMGERRAGELFGPTQPQGIVVEADTPLFQWQTLPGPTTYEIEILDMSHASVAKSPSLTTGEWRSPAPLARGRTYVWQVTALSNGKRRTAPAPPAPEVRFRVLESEALADLEHARAIGGPHIALVVLDARHGLLQAAQGELSKLQAANPEATKLQELAATLQSTSLD